ncbi:MAG: tetratricopeptide repeat protein [Desulfuromonadales bacterium]|nr:tetratricopeptide repeat protein [Desulfuromonadales bacterium]
MKRFIPAGLLLLLFALPALAMPEEGSSKVEQLRRSVEAIPENLNLRYYLGSALLEDGFFPEAIVELRKAYPAYVDSTEMNYTLAIAFYQVGDLDSALLYLEQAEDLGALLQPETYSVVNLHYKIGLKHLERASFQEAERAFLKVLQLGAGRLQIHRTLGDLYNRMGDPDRSLAEFERYYHLSPEDDEVEKFLYNSYLNRGLDLLNAGEAAQAGVLFDKALAINTENSRAAYFKGYLAYQQEDYSRAARILLPLLPLLSEEARSNSLSLLYNCALELSKSDATLQEALDILTPLLADEEAGEEELFLAGHVLMKLGHYQQALALYEKILAHEPAHEGALLNLLVAQRRAVEELTAKGWDLLKEGRIVEAQQTAEAALKIDPAHKRAGLLKGQVLYTRDQYVDNYLVEAEKQLTQGDLAAALQQARQALALNPELGAGSLLQEKILSVLSQELGDRLVQGQAALLKEDIAAAAGAFDAVLLLDPDNAAALSGRERITTILQEQAEKSAEKGRIALEKGAPAAAIVAFTAALQVLPELPVATEGLAAAHALSEKIVNQKIRAAKEALGNNNYGEALRQLQSARQLQDSPLLRQEIEATRVALAARVAELIASAEQAAGKNDFKYATSLYRKVLDIDPGNPTAKSRVAELNRAGDSALSGYLRQAREAMRENKIPLALAAYKKVLDLDSGNAAALQGLRDWEAQAGQHLLSLETRAAAALAKGDYDQSEQLYKEVLALAPGRTTASEGIKKLEQLRGAGLNPADGERLYLEGIALYTQGRYSEAVTVWRKVQQLDPGHVKAGLNIEKALRKLQSIKERRDV